MPNDDEETLTLPEVVGGKGEVLIYEGEDSSGSANCRTENLRDLLDWIEQELTIDTPLALSARWGKLSELDQ